MLSSWCGLSYPILLTALWGGCSYRTSSYRWRNWGWENLSTCPMSPQEGSMGAGNWNNSLFWYLSLHILRGTFLHSKWSWPIVLFGYLGTCKERSEAEETGSSLGWSLAFLGVYFCTFWIWYQGLPYQLKTTINNFYFQPQSLVTFRDTFIWCLPLDVLQDLKVLHPKLSFWSSP